MAETRYAMELLVPRSGRRYVADVATTDVGTGSDHFFAGVPNGILLDRYEGEQAHFSLLDKRNVTAGDPLVRFASWVTIDVVELQVTKWAPQNALVNMTKIESTRPMLDRMKMPLIVLSTGGPVAPRERHPFEAAEPALNADMTVRYNTLCLTCGLPRKDHVEPMPAPPKFSSTAEADAWMAKYEDAAVGSIDEVLGKGSIHV